MSSPSLLQGVSLLVVTAPSGAGKTTFIREWMRRHESFVFSASYTTRPKRFEEKNGMDYYFVDEPFFEQKIKEPHFFLEWAKVQQYYYGTSYEEIRRKAQKDQYKVILDIDVQGGMSLMERHVDAFYLGLTVKNMKVIQERLTKRGTEDPTSLSIRLKNAEKELHLLSQWPHVIINDDLETSLSTLEDLLQREGFYDLKK